MKEEAHDGGGAWAHKAYGSPIESNSYQGVLRHLPILSTVLSSTALLAVDLTTVDHTGSQNHNGKWGRNSITSFSVPSIRSDSLPWLVVEDQRIQNRQRGGCCVINRVESKEAPVVADKGDNN